MEYIDQVTKMLRGEVGFDEGSMQKFNSVIQLPAFLCLALCLQR